MTNHPSSRAESQAPGGNAANRQERTVYPMWTFCAHTQRPIGRLRWWLLPHVGYYCDDTEHWRWWMRPARWAWIALGWLPASGMYVSKGEWQRLIDELPAEPVRIPTKEEIASAHAARIEREIILGPKAERDEMQTPSPERPAANRQESAPKVMVPLEGGLVVQCRFCQGTGSVPDVSQWPPQKVCPGCKGAGVHRV